MKILFLTFFQFFFFLLRPTPQTWRDASIKWALFQVDWVEFVLSWRIEKRFLLFVWKHFCGSLTQPLKWVSHPSLWLSSHQQHWLLFFIIIIFKNSALGQFRLGGLSWSPESQTQPDSTEFEYGWVCGQFDAFFIFFPHF